MMPPNVSRRIVGGRNIRLEIEYDGSNYSGWQVQPKGRGKTIQGVIEKTLRKLLQEKIKLIVSGRTDSGVHARAQVANFFTHSRRRGVCRHDHAMMRAHGCFRSGFAEACDHE